MAHKITHERGKKEWLKFGIPKVPKDRIEFYSVFSLLRYAVYAFENATTDHSVINDFSDAVELAERIAKEKFLEAMNNDNNSKVV